MPKSTGEERRDGEEEDGKGERGEEGRAVEKSEEPHLHQEECSVVFSVVLKIVEILWYARVAQLAQSGGLALKQLQLLPVLQPSKGERLHGNFDAV